MTDLQLRRVHKRQSLALIDVQGQHSVRQANITLFRISWGKQWERLVIQRARGQALLFIALKKAASSTCW
jgi:hypothetical protein